MKEIRLTDGTLLEVKINFLTMKLIVDEGIEELSNKVKKKEDKKIKMDIAAKLIYIILRSNGKKVDKDEACMLVPADDKIIEELFSEFADKINKFKKKQENKM